MEEVKIIPVQIVIKEFLFTFEYETRRGHRRQQQRIIRHLDKKIAKQLFKEWSEKVRTMTNVKILDIAELEDKEKIIVP